MTDAATCEERVEKAVGELAAALWKQKETVSAYEAALSAQSVVDTFRGIALDFMRVAAKGPSDAS